MIIALIVVLVLVFVAAPLLGWWAAGALHAAEDRFLAWLTRRRRQ